MELKLIALALEVGADLHWLHEGFLEGERVAWVAQLIKDLGPSWEGNSMELAERIFLLAKEV